MRYLILAVAALTSKLAQTKSLIKQFDLPRAHMLLERYSYLSDDNQGLVNATNCSRLWWLERILDQEETHLQIQDPYVNLRLRGRPCGGGAFAVTVPRDPDTLSRAVPPSHAPASQGTSSSICLLLSEWEIVSHLEDEHDVVIPKQRAQEHDWESIVQLKQVLQAERAALTQKDS